MRQICKYDKSRDIRETAPFLAIDLKEVIRTGKVPATGTEPNYNDIQNASDVTGRIQDVFQSIDVERATLAQGKADAAQAKADKAAAEAAAAAAAQAASQAAKSTE